MEAAIQQDIRPKPDYGAFLKRTGARMISLFDVGASDNEFFNSLVASRAIEWAFIPLVFDDSRAQDIVIAGNESFGVALALDAAVRSDNTTLWVRTTGRLLQDTLLVSRLRETANAHFFCWGEYDAVRGVFERLSSPTKILEIGPGLGRSAVFFAKKLDWTNAVFHLYEGNGNSIPKYTAFAPRSEDSFCGDTTQLKMLLDFNGVNNVEVFDAKIWKLEDLPGPYDFVYSFYCVGFHWALEHFLADIAGLIHSHTLLIFTVPQSFGPCKELEGFFNKLVPLRAAWPSGTSHQLLLLSQDRRILQE